MRSEYILEGETLSDLATRLNVPSCMLMRANGLYSPAWLLPGRRVIVPEGACGGEIPCPAAAFAQMIGEDEETVRAQDTLESLAGRLGVPGRLILRALGMKGGCPPVGTTLSLGVKGRVIVCGPADTLPALGQKYGCGADRLRAVNRLEGGVLPGMELLIPED